MSELEGCVLILVELHLWFSISLEKAKKKWLPSKSICICLVKPQVFNEEVSIQKIRTRDAMAAGKKLLRDSSMDEETDVREKMEALRGKTDAVTVATGERLGSLEQALPLARSFNDTHSELDSWLGEVEPQLAQLSTLTVDADQVKRQQEAVKVRVVLGWT